MELHKLYRPLTAAPFAGNHGYREFPPCQALAPYIRCFWGMGQWPYRNWQPQMGQSHQSPQVTCVIPDTCADLLFEIDFTGSRLCSRFCGISDGMFQTSCGQEAGEHYLFGIRFYAWSVVLFSEDSLRSTCNCLTDAGQHFGRIKREMEGILFEAESPEALVEAAEKILLKNLRVRQENAAVWEAVGMMILKKGNLRTGGLAGELHRSSRQMERLFGEYIGISPKKLASLIRYQYLWRDILESFHLNMKNNREKAGAAYRAERISGSAVLDWVEQYGYTDQAHLLRDFKKYHSMTISQARTYALQFLPDVAFLQE